ncbi:MAG TPA: hypothetical protein VF299_07410 [Mycobacterium sp.]
MWCPSATLSVWANAWLAGRAAPDDVLDALSHWAPTHSVVAYDAVSAGSAGLPWPDPPGGYDGGAVTLLQTLRSGGMRSGRIRSVFPVPGDVRGLPAGGPFAHDALAMGEAVIVAGADEATVVGLVPEFTESSDLPDDTLDPVGALSWTVHCLPAIPVVDDHDLGDAEYTLRSAVRSAAEALGAAGVRYAGVDDADPRLMVEQLLESTRRHRVPGYAPSRAVRVLESAAHIDAIITVCSELAATGTQYEFDGTMRQLAATVRSARTAAINAILRAAWDG